MTANTSHRLNWIAILQGWAIFLVVAGHATLRSEIEGTQWYQPVGDVVSDFAYSFHMPLFVFVSGYLFAYTRIGKGKSYFDLLKSKFIRFGCPFLFFTLVGIVLKNMFGEFMERPTQISFAELANAFLYPADGPLCEFWFLAVLMWYFFLSPLFTAATNSKIGSAVTFIALAALNIWAPVSSTLFCAYNAQLLAVYFAAGIIVQRYGLFEWKGKSLYISAAVAAILYTVSFATRQYTPAIITALCGIWLSVELARVADRHVPKLFSSYRNYTYQIYLLAIYFQVVVRLTYERYLSLEWFYPAFIAGIAAGLYLPVIISRATERFGNRAARLCLGLDTKRPK